VARLLSRGRPEAAGDVLERALRGLATTDPRNAMGKLLLGRAKARLREVDVALALYEQAMKQATK
jgi:cytochrome c-type biogenesis protein CcmH/NrfG